MKLLFLGPPGAGKGTQAERIAEHLGLAHISTGDMFRWHVSEGTHLGQQVNEIMREGALVPDSLTISMLNQRIALPDAERGYILDGFPRTLPQAEALDGAIGAGALSAVVVLDVREDVLISRLLERGRTDDTETSVKNRLNVYMKDTEPLIGLYESRGIVTRVEGVGDIDDISARIIAALDA